MRIVTRAQRQVASIAGSAMLMTAPAASLDTTPRPAREVERTVASLDAMTRAPSPSYVARRHLEAELVERGERAWMDVTTRFDGARVLSHTIEGEGGSVRIRRRALAVLLEQETQACARDEMRRSSLSSENYRHEVLESTWDVVRIALTPVRADERLIAGTAVIDAGTGDLLEVEGRLARSPSFWVRDVRVRRTYGQLAGVSLPIEFVSTARVRLFGAARLRVRSAYVEVNGRPVHGALSTRLGK